MLKKENKKLDLDNFYIVDFDRTLVDSDKMFEVFVEVARTFIDIPTQQIELAELEIKQKGDSFDTAGYVRECLNREGRRDVWDDLQKKYIHESRSLNYLLPGAAELLEWFDKKGEKIGIVTYGNPLWQHIKLTAAGFNHANHIITETKEKGRLVRRWRDNNIFHLPDALGGYTVKAITMIDDKAISFLDFPNRPSGGYWVLDPLRELPSQQGTVPKNVSRHNNLYSVLNDLILVVK